MRQATGSRKLISSNRHFIDKTQKLVAAKINRFIVFNLQHFSFEFCELGLEFGNRFIPCMGSVTVGLGVRLGLELA